MTGWWVATGSAAVAAALVLPWRARAPEPAGKPAGAEAASPDRGWMRRHRVLWSLSSGAGALLFVTGAVGGVVAAVVVVVTWVGIGRTEPPQVRRTREEVRRDLPHLVALLAAALRAGAAPGDGIAVVCAALPGAAADRLSVVSARLAVGVDPADVWAALSGDPELAPLGRALARSHLTGASVVPVVERLAEDLGRRARGEVEDRARAVGVRAALPLGLCLLPAFILVGIVPLVAGLLAGLQL
jgi:Flp pilus assembly protein TadB